MTDISRFRVLARFIRPYRGRLALAITLAVIIPLSGAVPPLTMRYLIDDVIVGTQHKQLATVVAIFAALPVTVALFNMLNRLVVGVLGQRFIIQPAHRIVSPHPLP